MVIAELIAQTETDQENVSLTLNYQSVRFENGWLCLTTVENIKFRNDQWEGEVELTPVGKHRTYHQWILVVWNNEKKEWRYTERPKEPCDMTLGESVECEQSSG